MAAAANIPASLALFLALNLLFFTLSSACGTCPPTPKPPKPSPTPGGGSGGGGSGGGGSGGSGGGGSGGGGSSGGGSGGSGGGGSGGGGSGGGGSGGSGGGGSGGGGGGGSGGGGSGGGGSGNSSCPVNALKLGVCANVLGLIKAKVGAPPQLPCCSLLQGLVDLEAAVCLCTAIKANILGIKLNLPIDLSLILNYCGRGTPSGFKCA